MIKEFTYVLGIIGVCVFGYRLWLLLLHRRWKHCELHLLRLYTETRKFSILDMLISMHAIDILVIILFPLTILLDLSHGALARYVGAGGHWAVLALVGLFVSYSYLRRERFIKHNKTAQGRMCPFCFYPLRGIEPEARVRCPECGEFVRSEDIRAVRWLLLGRDRAIAPLHASPGEPG